MSPAPEWPRVIRGLLCFYPGNYPGPAATLDEFGELAKRVERSLDREQQRHWGGREYDEYIIAAQGVLPDCATPEELVCQRETLDEILAVLALPLKVALLIEFLHELRQKGQKIDILIFGLRDPGEMVNAAGIGLVAVEYWMIPLPASAALMKGTKGFSTE